jgi:peptide/nickel transport system permease protein
MAAAERLVLEDVSVAFARATRPVVRQVSLAIEPGESYGLVGESGCGKTMTARAILGLVPMGATVTGRILFGERSLLDLPEKKMQALRGSQIGMVFQDPATFLNPLLRVGDAIAQVVQSHEQTTRRAAKQRAVESMARVGIREPHKRARDYPHEFSGGMQQRVLIAMALAARPSLLLADEPTTALDVIVQAGILRLLDQLRREESMSLLLVSHDFSVVAGMCQRVGVMYAGQLVEEGSVSDVLFKPRHPYTQALIESSPEGAGTGPLPSIPGSPPEPSEIPNGCAFAARCRYVTDECIAAPVPMLSVSAHHASRCIHSEKLRTGDHEREWRGDDSGSELT